VAVAIRDSLLVTNITQQPHVTVLFLLSALS